MDIISISYTDTPSSSHASQFWNFKTASVSFDQLKQIVISKAWSPFVFREGKRKESNFIETSIIALDFDDCEQGQLQEFARKFCDMKHIIAPTKSHQIEKNGIVCDRFRMMFFTEQKIKCIDTYKYNVKKLIAKLGADKQCKDGARFFFPSKKIVSDNSEGYFFEIDEPDLLALKLKAHKFASINNFYISNGVLPPWVTKLLNTKIEHGERNNTVFRVSCAMLEIGESVDNVIKKITESVLYIESGVPISEIKTTAISAARYLNNKKREIV